MATSAGLSKKEKSLGNICFCFTDYAKVFNCMDHKKLWNILKEMEIPDHLNYLLRNLYAGQEATVRTRHGTTDWFQIGKGVHQGCLLSPCLFNFYAEYIMRNTGLEEAQAGIKIARRPRGIGWRGRWEGGSGWGTHVNPWLFHFNVWKNPLQ